VCVCVCVFVFVFVCVCVVLKEKDREKDRICSFILFTLFVYFIFIFIFKFFFFRVERSLQGNPKIISNLSQFGCEFHVISKDHATSDLPYLRQWKGLRSCLFVFVHVCLFLFMNFKLFQKIMLQSCWNIFILFMFVLCSCLFLIWFIHSCLFFFRNF